jgi:hypothetical protein
MKDVGRWLKLAPHIIQGKEIYGPGDIEVHLSAQDQEYYILDFARVWPSEAHLRPYVVREGSRWEILVRWEEYGRVKAGGIVKRFEGDVTRGVREGGGGSWTGVI